MDKLHAMKTFVRVVEAGSFSAVAHESNTTQSAVSKQVAALEKVLGAKLLTRTTRALALTDEGERYFEQTVERFGRIDVAINNAGTEGQLGPITEQSVDNYEATFATNVLGTLLSVKHEMRVMLAQGSGSIVNLSSIAGQVGVAGASVYAASKHAVEGITKSAALEGATAGVRVNAVAPGPVATEMLERFVGGSEEAKAGFLSTIPAKRAATPDEIVQTILFLASDKARYLTGQRIAVDGGYTAQ